MDSIEKDVIDWHRNITCIPTWDELLEIVYLIRMTTVNMFSIDIRVRLKDLGFLKTLDWYDRCEKAGVHPSTYFGIALREHDNKGPIDTWLTPDVIKMLESRKQHV